MYYKLLKKIYVHFFLIDNDNLQPCFACLFEIFFSHHSLQLTFPSGNRSIRIPSEKRGLVHLPSPVRDNSAMFLDRVTCNAEEIVRRVFCMRNLHVSLVGFPSNQDISPGGALSCRWIALEVSDDEKIFHVTKQLFYFIPNNLLDILKSFGFMQRMYEGSFPIKISIRLFRLFLNCVTAVSGRFLLFRSFTENTLWKFLIQVWPLLLSQWGSYVFVKTKFEIFSVRIGESRQPWAGVCLGPNVFFKKKWKKNSWIFYMKLRKWFR